MAAAPLSVNWIDVVGMDKHYLGCSGNCRHSSVLGWGNQSVPAHGGNSLTWFWAFKSSHDTGDNSRSFGLLLPHRREFCRPRQMPKKGFPKRSRFFIGSTRWRWSHCCTAGSKILTPGSTTPSACSISDGESARSRLFSPTLTGRECRFPCRSL